MAITYTLLKWLWKKYGQRCRWTLLWSNNIYWSWICCGLWDDKIPACQPMCDHPATRQRNSQSGHSWKDGSALWAYMLLTKWTIPLKSWRCKVKYNFNDGHLLRKIVTMSSNSSTSLAPNYTERWAHTEEFTLWKKPGAGQVRQVINSFNSSVTRHSTVSSVTEILTQTRWSMQDDHRNTQLKNSLRSCCQTQITRQLWSWWKPAALTLPMKKPSRISREVLNIS